MLFVKQDGSLVKQGDRLYMHTLASTLSRIAEDPMSFYYGSLAADIAADIQDYSTYNLKFTIKCRPFLFCKFRRKNLLGVPTFAKITRQHEAKY